jgi:thiamine-phosphate pyrophosphorylase
MSGTGSPDLRSRLQLIVIADPDAVADRALLEVVRAALQAGAPAIQLRAKALGTRDTVDLGHAIVTETRHSGALFFVNDRIDVALVVGADGAHLGDDDLPLPAARSITPPGFLLGRSVDTPDQARRAEWEGADYVGLGPVYATASKADLGAPIGPDGVRAVVQSVTLPVVAIGGITTENAAAVIHAGAAGIAVIRSVVAAPDPAAAVADLRRVIQHRIEV